MNQNSRFRPIAAEVLTCSAMSPSSSSSQVETALKDRDFALVRKTLTDQLPQDVAEIIETLHEEDRALLFRVLRRDQAADTFEYLSAETQESLIRSLADEQVATILNDMAPDDRTALLEEMPASVTRQLLALLSPEERKVARKLLGYPEDSVGRLMTPYFIALSGEWTVQDSLNHIRAYGEDSETLNILYVVDEKGRLIDDLRTRYLLLADPTSQISSIIDGRFAALRATEDQESAVRVFAEYDRVALPVTDSSGVLIGIVTVDDVLDVIEEEATEDIQKIGGTVALEHPFMQIGFAEMLKKRAGWLVLLFMGQLLTLNAMGFFRSQIEEAIVLVLFVPLIISSGGNSGSQAATLVIRALALEEIGLGDWWKVMRREIAFGMTLGVVLASIGFARVMFDPTDAFGDQWAQIAVAVGVALVSVVLWGVLIGSMLPFALRRMGADPAASSTPFVATIVDVTGLVLYFGVASLILR